jgi:hypothetical protein
MKVVTLRLNSSQQDQPNHSNDNSKREHGGPPEGACLEFAPPHEERMRRRIFQRRHVTPRH